MGDQIKRWEVDRANRVLEKMRAALKAATANLTPSQQAAAMAELERLISTAIRHQSQMRRNDCGKWALEVIDKVGKTDYLKLGASAWEYRKWQIGVGIPFTDWFLGHNAVEVTLPDGSVFYLDNGWWNHAFTPGDVPWYVTPWRPTP